MITRTTMFKRVMPVLALMLRFGRFSADDIAKQTIAFEAATGPTPLISAAMAPAPMPMVVLLHGTAATGFTWRRPGKTSPPATEQARARSAHHPDIDGIFADGLDYIHAVMARAAANTAIDPRRIYLFGQSGGAFMRCSWGCWNGIFLAAVAIHAGSWRCSEEYKAQSTTRRERSRLRFRWRPRSIFPARRRPELATHPNLAWFSGGGDYPEGPRAPLFRRAGGFQRPGLGFPQAHHAKRRPEIIPTIIIGPRCGDTQLNRRPRPDQLRQAPVR